MPSEQSRFRKHSDEIVHSWAIADLVRRTVEGPQGQLFERTFTATPGAVAAVALHDDGRVVLVSQYRASVDDEVIELPAGMRDVKDEPPLETAQRELIEEAGYLASEWAHLGRCMSSPGVTNSLVEIYLAKGLTQVEAEPHGPEEDAMMVLEPSLQEALFMIERGEIVDSKTVMGLLLAARLHPHLAT